MEDVCKKTVVRDQQLDQEIPESDIIQFTEKSPQVNSTLNHNHPDILARGANGVHVRY